MMPSIESVEKSVETVALFEPYKLGDISLANRFVMAPMTRSRASRPGDHANALMAEYYEQRASAGLIITEPAQVSHQGMGYARTPGIYTFQQIKGWQLTTQAVHKAGSQIFLQLWHAGRVSSDRVNGLQPIAPSALRAEDAQVYIFEGPPYGNATLIPADTPRSMTACDIQQVIVAFRQAAENAIAAGFDGVEINGGNGYLIDQFLRGTSNQRTDRYGGSPVARTRLLIEITQAVIAAVGKERTGVVLSPLITTKNMDSPGNLETCLLAAEQLNDLDIAYLHLCESDSWEDDRCEFFGEALKEAVRVELRSVFKNTLIMTGHYPPDQAQILLTEGYADLIGFAREFAINPDYPARVRTAAALNKIRDIHTLIGGGNSRGYTDYPTLESAHEYEWVMADMR